MRYYPAKLDSRDARVVVTDLSSYATRSVNTFRARNVALLKAIMSVGQVPDQLLQLDLPSICFDANFLNCIDVLFSKGSRSIFLSFLRFPRDCADSRCVASFLSARLDCCPRKRTGSYKSISSIYYVFISHFICKNMNNKACVYQRCERLNEISSEFTFFYYFLFDLTIYYSLK